MEGGGVHLTHFAWVTLAALSQRKCSTNSSLSPDFSVQLKVSLSEKLSKRLCQKVKSPNGSAISFFCVW